MSHVLVSHVLVMTQTINLTPTMRLMKVVIQLATNDQVLQQKRLPNRRRKTLQKPNP